MSILSKLTDLPEKHEELARDFQKRYENTYMLYKDDKRGEIVVSCQGIDATNNTIHCLTKAGERILIPSTAPEETLKPFLPECGYFNVRGVPHYLIKYPQRQWKRSCCSNIYIVQHAYPSMREDAPRRDIWSQAAWAMHTRDFVHLDEISKKIQGNAALSKAFATIIDEEDDCILIYKRHRLGRLNFEKRTISLFSSTLFQEVSDFLHRTKVKTWNLMPIQTA